MKILSASAGKLTLMDALLIAGSKSVTERILAKFIGNGTLFSGGAKIISGIALNKLVSGKIGDIFGTAMLVDGTEDIVQAFFGGALNDLVAGSSSSSVNVI